MGTPGYMAPELLGLLPQMNSYDMAVDMWAVGCIVYQMVTLQFPFAACATLLSSYWSCVATEPTSSPPSNLTLLQCYCRGQIPFPEENLQIAGASDHETAFIKGLLVADPASRLSARAALETAWLLESTAIASPSEAATRQAREGLNQNSRIVNHATAIIRGPSLAESLAQARLV